MILTLPSEEFSLFVQRHGSSRPGINYGASAFSGIPTVLPICVSIRDARKATKFSNRESL
jgi:hypothetical protein